MDVTQKFFTGLLVSFALGGSSLAAARSVPVTVVNMDSDPVPVTIADDAGKIPYQGRVGISRTGPEEPVYTPLEPAVAPGMTLTIEYISGRCSVGGLSKSFHPTLETTFQGAELTHPLVPNLTNTITTDDYRTLRYVVSQKVTILADTDYPIEASYSQVFSGGDWPDVGCRLIVTGYLENP